VAYKTVEIAWVPSSAKAWATFTASRLEAARLWGELVVRHKRIRRLRWKWPSKGRWEKWAAPTKFVRFTWKDKKNNPQELILDRAELQTLMFLLAPSEDEHKYLQERTRELKRNRHQFKVKAQKDIRKGEEVIINKYIT